MGPRSTDRGNRHQEMFTPPPQQASMGPRSTDRGNSPPRRICRSSSALQWGRDQLIAEIFAEQHGGGGRGGLQWGRDQLIAEMRPAADRRAAAATASMGPRSTDRGNNDANEIEPILQQLQWGRDQLIAEMCSLTKPAHQRSALQWGRDQLIAEMYYSRYMNADYDWLQWGRDQLIAEIPSAINNVIHDLPLQWGRDQLIAEITLLQVISTGDQPASMGPRSTDRGNVLVVARRVGCRFVLQWGRDQLIAEMLTLDAIGGNLTMLQWGRDQLIAEIFQVDGVRVAHALASMGPRSTDRGNFRRSRSHIRAVSSFNGAAIN